MYITVATLTNKNNMDFEKVSVKEANIGTKRDQIESAVSQIEDGQALKITGESVNTVRSYIIQIFGSGKYSVTKHGETVYVTKMENK